jgi:hypothetical protein
MGSPMDDGSAHIEITYMWDLNETPYTKRYEQQCKRSGNNQILGSIRQQSLFQ